MTSPIHKWISFLQKQGLYDGDLVDRTDDEIGTILMEIRSGLSISLDGSLRIKDCSFSEKDIVYMLARRSTKLATYFSSICDDSEENDSNVMFTDSDIVFELEYLSSYKGRDNLDLDLSSLQEKASRLAFCKGPFIKFSLD